MAEVTVIIPVYNNERHVEKCIRSVMNQTFRDLEIIVINDGSTDGCRAILETLAAEDERIRLFHQENSGVAAARNKGIDAARGEYLTFVDGDDYIEEEYIRKLYECAQKAQAELVICGLSFVDEAGNVLKKVVPGEYRRFEKEEWTFRISAVCSHLYRKSLWESWGIRFVSGERGEDMPISLFFSAVCDKIATLPEAGYFYVQHESSAMHNFKGLKTYNLPYRALESVLRKIQETGVKNSREFYELFILRILSTCFFQLGRGASKERMRELCDYTVRILKEYLPMYYKNKKASLSADIEVPFFQKAAVWLFVRLVRTGLIYPASRLMTGRQTMK